VAARYGTSVAAQKGASALVIRSVGTDNNRLAHTGMTNYEDGVKRIPAVAISNPDADILVHQLSYGKTVKLSLKVTAKRDDKKRVKTYSVIGDILGSDKPEEIVVLGAHLDSWDVGTGAIDDGLGVSIALASARHILELAERPKRTIRVILFAGEEVGMLGAKQYVKHHKDNIKNHVIGVEWDFGLGRIYKMTTGVGPSALNDMREFATYIAPLGVALSADNDAKGQSDLSFLGNEGMPAVSFSPDGTNYFDIHHTENDTMDKVDREALQFNTAIYTLFTYFTAQSDVDFRQ
jgi:Zn-dependent M28 family amino/carboxypeptidase